MLIILCIIFSENQSIVPRTWATRVGRRAVQYATKHASTHSFALNFMYFTCFRRVRSVPFTLSSVLFYIMFSSYSMNSQHQLVRNDDQLKVLSYFTLIVYFYIPINFQRSWRNKYTQLSTLSSHERLTLNH